MLGTVPLPPSGSGPAGEAPILNDAAGEVALAVALGAMPRPIHQIGARFQLAGLDGSGRKTCPSRKASFQRPTPRRILNGNGRSWSRHAALDGGKRLHEGEEVAEILGVIRW